MPTYLSPHFTLAELTTTTHREYDNTPTPEIITNLTQLANSVLETVRQVVGPMHVNSGYRSPEINTAVGGQPTSQHCFGLACDFVPLNMNLKDAVDAILASGLIFDQLIYECTWIHISMNPSDRPPRKQALMYGKFTKNKYLPYDSSAIP